MNALVPALDRRIVREFLPLPTIGTDPRVDCHVRDRIKAGEIFRLLQALLDHRVKAGRLARVAFDRVLDLRGSVLAEMVGLAEHWADSAHLKHQPLQDRVVVPLAVRKKLLTVSVGEIDHDGAGLEDRNRRATRAVRVRHGGDFAVGTDPEEIRRKLLALPDMDGKHPVRQGKFLEEDADLVAVL